MPLPYEDLSQRDIRVSTRSSEASAVIERFPGRLEMRLDVADAKTASLETEVTFTAFQQRGGIRDFAEGATGSTDPMQISIFALAKVLLK